MDDFLATYREHLIIAAAVFAATVLCILAPEYSLHASLAANLYWIFKG
jgi:hypothetical protein